MQMLSRLVPGPLVRFFARPYVAGDSIDAALDVAHDIYKSGGLLTTLDLLSEGVTEPEQIADNIDVYREMIDRVAADKRNHPEHNQPTVSIKPSGFTVTTQAAAREPLTQLAVYATEQQVALTIDMEDRHWTDFTLAVATDLFRAGHDVGIVLQTRLHRTQSDLTKIPAGMRVRIVIGIYPEPAEAAITDKNEMKERLLTYGRTLLERGAYVEFATHDEAIVERFVRDVAPIAPDRCEVQMLLGVPRDKLQLDLTSGTFGIKLPVRLYVPFAIGWTDATAYLRRRMAESPSMVWLVLRNIAARRTTQRQVNQDP